MKAVVAMGASVGRIAACLLLCTAATAFGGATQTLQPRITVDCAYPGGNVRVLGVDETNGVVRVAPDLRDTAYHWFHFDFTVRGAEGRKLRFEFPHNGELYLASLGPAVRSGDGAWRWLNADGRRHEPADAFDYTFGPDERVVRFAMSVPYVQQDWDRFVAPWRSRPDVRFETLCKSQGGTRDVELVRLPCRGKADWVFAFTARHHACETTGDAVMEGVLAAALADTAEARWAREHAECLFVPFMDKDGVEAGDQGKGRSPWDHNGDYLQERYATVRAFKRLLVRESEGKRIVFVDLHAPYVRSSPGQEWHDHVHCYGASRPEHQAHLREFCARLRRLTADGAIAYSGKYDVGPGHPVWKSLEAAWANGRMGADPWVRTLPNAHLATCFEFGYSLCDGITTFPALREFGARIFRAAVENARRLTEGRGA